jgi:hypothetical protein
MDQLKHTIIPPSPNTPLGIWNVIVKQLQKILHGKSPCNPLSRRFCKTTNTTSWQDIIKYSKIRKSNHSSNTRLWLAICFKIQQKYSFNFNKFIHIQQKYSFNFKDGLQSVLRMRDSFCFGRLLISRVHGFQFDCIIYARFCICWYKEWEYWIHSFEEIFNELWLLGSEIRLI